MAAGPRRHAWATRHARDPAASHPAWHGVARARRAGTGRRARGPDHRGDVRAAARAHRTLRGTTHAIRRDVRGPRARLRNRAEGCSSSPARATSRNAHRDNQVELRLSRVSEALSGTPTCSPTVPALTRPVPDRARPGVGCPGTARFGVGVHEMTFRVNVRWVTPLGEETASTS